MSRAPVRPTAVVVDGLSKQFGTVAAVSDISFTAAPGRVTGFLGPNGAGKSTTLRMLLGLITPDSGTATIGTLPYRNLPRPSSSVGAMLDIAAAHPAMTARRHLQIQADLGEHPRHRIQRVLSLSGLERAADRRTGSFSTGMRQRLALATALLGDPPVLILDEPSAGLDPAGVAWLRQLLRNHAADGGTVLISSHQLAELEHTVDDLVLINQGRLLWSGPRADFTADHRDLEAAFLASTMPRDAEPATAGPIPGEPT